MCTVPLLPSSFPVFWHRQLFVLVRWNPVWILWLSVGRLHENQLAGERRLVSRTVALTHPFLRGLGCCQWLAQCWTCDAVLGVEIVADSASAWPLSAGISAAQLLSPFVVDSPCVFSLALMILLALAASRLAVSPFALWIHVTEIQ